MERPLGDGQMAMDDSVVKRLRAKDAQAFRSLIERLQQPVTGYLHRLVGDREVALDLTQDTFLQVYKEIGNTREDLALDAYLSYCYEFWPALSQSQTLEA